LLENTVSRTVAMMTPAMADAQPLRKASLENTRDTNDAEALSVDME
jgi:hypothetical protein